VNTLIQRLEKDDALTMDALRRLYRTLALKCHPDVTKESAKAFVQLQLEYEDAIRQILKQEKSRNRQAARRMRTGEDPRSFFLRTLYLYAIVHDRSYWKDIHQLLVESAEAYGGAALAAIRQYKKAFLVKPNEWKGDSPAAVAHERLMLAIKQLGCYYENGVYPNKRLFLSYVGDLEPLAKLLDNERRVCILSFGEYSKKEADGPRIRQMMAWDGAG
jgi:hypothetical protein